MPTSPTTSHFTERLVYLTLADGHYRKHLSRLHKRLGESRPQRRTASVRMGLVVCRTRRPHDHLGQLPASGGFAAQAEAPQHDGIALAPGLVRPART
jgi:hypothetical protein